MDKTTVRERMDTDLKEAMRGGDRVARDAIRYTLAAIKNAEIERRGPLPPQDQEAVVRRVQKQLDDAIVQYRAACREDLAAHEEAQLAVIRRYLPAELGDAELEAEVAAVVEELRATGPKDMGRVMPAAMARLGPRVDGRRLNAAVRARLARGA